MGPFRIAPILLIATLTAACSPGGLGTSNGPFAPGISTRDADQAVDPRIVGNRLMDAGEYELALKSYYRAAAKHGLTAEILTSIASANLGLGRLGQAEKQLRQALDMDDHFVPAWNNLGVVLMERGEFREAALVFKTAFALDSGETAEIRDNLALALAKSDNPSYTDPEKSGPQLVRRGTGDYVLEVTP